MASAYGGQQQPPPGGQRPPPQQQQQPSTYAPPPGMQYQQQQQPQRPPFPQQQPQQQPPPVQQQQQFFPGAALQSAAAQVMMNPDAWQSISTQAWGAGQTYMNQNLKGWIDWEPWRCYWNVSNGYVFNKLRLVLFPFRHKHWDRMVVRSETNGQLEGFKPPRFDVNAPDLYIPVMAFVTYTLLVGIAMGMEDRFKPEILTMTASTALFFTVVQVMFLRLGMYLLNVQPNDMPIQLTDLVGYCGYQYISIIFVQLCSKAAANNGWIWFGLFSYASFALAWFTLRTLRHVVLPSSDATAIIPTAASAHRKRKVYFLFMFVLVQMFSVWWLLK